MEVNMISYIGRLFYAVVSTVLLVSFSLHAAGAGAPHAVAGNARHAAAQSLALGTGVTGRGLVTPTPAEMADLVAEHQAAQLGARSRTPAHPLHLVEYERAPSPELHIPGLPPIEPVRWAERSFLPEETVSEAYQLARQAVDDLGPDQLYRAVLELHSEDRFPRCLVARLSSLFVDEMDAATKKRLYICLELLFNFDPRRATHGRALNSTFTAGQNLCSHAHGGTPCLFKGSQTALCNLFSCAIARGARTITRAMLTSGINLDAQDKEGNTLLHYAVYKGKLASANELIRNGARADIRNDNNHYALDMLNIPSRPAYHGYNDPAIFALLENQSPAAAVQAYFASVDGAARAFPEAITGVKRKLNLIQPQAGIAQNPVDDADAAEDAAVMARVEERQQRRRLEEAPSPVHRPYQSLQLYGRAPAHASLPAVALAAAGAGAGAHHAAGLGQAAAAGAAAHPLQPLPAPLPAMIPAMAAELIDAHAGAGTPQNQIRRN